MPINEETQPRVKALFWRVKNHEWESLRDLREFRGDQDDLIVYAVAGPHPGGVVVLIRDPTELWASEEIYQGAVTAEEVARIKGLVPADAWQEL